MPLGFLGSIFGSAISAQASAANTAQINKTNLEIAEKTNAANREMVEAQNKAAAAESEKAYQRSKASTQVSNMMQAGMSRAGAINALNGGGSYTPAPVNVSQDSAPQMQTADLSALSNIGQAFAQRAQQKHDEKMQAKQLEEQKRQFNEQLDFEKQKWNDEAPYRAENLTAIQFQNKINHELANYEDKNGNKTNLLVEGAAAERIANIAEQRLNALKYELINGALELPANALKALIREIKDSVGDAENFVEDIRSGKKTAKEIRDYSDYDKLPNEITTDGKKFRRKKLADGVYEWYEVK